MLKPLHPPTHPPTQNSKTAGKPRNHWEILRGPAFVQVGYWVQPTFGGVSQSFALFSYKNTQSININNVLHFLIPKQVKKMPLVCPVACNWEKMVQKCAASSFLAVEQFANAIAPKKIRKAKDGTFFCKIFIMLIMQIMQLACLPPPARSQKERVGWAFWLPPRTSMQMDWSPVEGKHIARHTESTLENSVSATMSNLGNNPQLDQQRQMTPFWKGVKKTTKLQHQMQLWSVTENQKKIRTQGGWNA